MTDSEAEVTALEEILATTGVDLIQMRNLAIDPVLYQDALKVEGEGMGMTTMLARIKRNFPEIQYGYFNRIRENFFPARYQTDWPLPA